MAQRKIAAIVVLLLSLCLLLPPGTARAASTDAAVEPIDVEADCSLTLTYANNKTPQPDIPVRLYRIAAVSADFQYTYESRFSEVYLPLNGISSAEAWNEVRSTLEAHIAAHAIEPDHTAQTDAAGQVCFAGLKPGLYLVSSGRAAQSRARSSFSSTLVALPGLTADGHWLYRVSAAPKSDRPPKPPGGGDDGDRTFRVLKLWKDDGAEVERPVSVEIDLFRDGELWKTIVLSAENNWSYEWTVVDDGSDWIAAERNVPDGYFMTLSGRGGTFVITNTVPKPDDPPGGEDPDDPPGIGGGEDPDDPDDPPGGDDPDDPPGLGDGEDPDNPPGGDGPDEPGTTGTDEPPSDTPKTGDTTNIGFYTALMYISGMLLLILGLTGKRGKR